MVELPRFPTWVVFFVLGVMLLVIAITERTGPFYLVATCFFLGGFFLGLSIFDYIVKITLKEKLEEMKQ